MKQILSLIPLLGLFLNTSCEENKSSQVPAELYKTLSVEKENICLNHTLLVLDSATYYALTHSHFINKFAFGYEKRFSDYQGTYLIGKNNYFEFFHPKSIEGEDLKKGEFWICLSALEPQSVIPSLSDTLHGLVYEEDAQFKYLSLMLANENNLVSLREMKKEQYESWTGKTYTDTTTFLPVDYNSPAESDSSQNYLFQSIRGIEIELSIKDSLRFTNYLKQMDYSLSTQSATVLNYEKEDHFLQLSFQPKIESPRIVKYTLSLNQTVKKHVEKIGNSTLTCEGNQAIWQFD